MQELLSSHTHCQPLPPRSPTLAPPNACTLSKPHVLISRPITGYTNSPCSSLPAFRSRKLEPSTLTQVALHAAGRGLSLYPGPEANTTDRSGMEGGPGQKYLKTRPDHETQATLVRIPSVNSLREWPRSMDLDPFPFQSDDSLLSQLPLHPSSSHNTPGRSHSQGAFAGTGGPRPARPGQARRLRLAGRGRPVVAARRVTRPGPASHVVNPNYYPASCSLARGGGR